MHIMRQEFWKDVQAGDALFIYSAHYDIHKMTVTSIKDVSEVTGSFVMVTDSKSHPEIFVFMNDFEKHGSPLTWDYNTNNFVYISDNYDELASHYKENIITEMERHKGILRHYEELLERYG